MNIQLAGRKSTGFNEVLSDDIDVIKKYINTDCIKDSVFLITGGCGTVLSYLVYFLLGNNCKVILLVKNRKKAIKKFGMFNNVKIIKNTLEEPIHIQGKIDYIIHGAGYAHSVYFDKYPVETIMPNTIGTYHLLNLALTKHIKKFVYISSTGVYGISDGPLGVHSCSIVDPSLITSCYTIAKLSGESLCRSFCKEYEVQISIARLTHNFGPTMDLDNDPRYVSYLFKSIRDKTDILLDGNPDRSFIYIADTTIALLKIILGTKTDIYNISDHNKYMNVKTLATTLLKIYNPGIEIKYLPYWSIPGCFASNSSLLDIGWNPVYPLDVALRKTLYSYEQT